MAPAREAGRKLWDWRWAAVALGGLLALSTVVYKPLGVSTAYATTWGMILDRIVPEWAERQPYLRAVGLSITPEWMLVMGVMIGGLLSAVLTRSRVKEMVPAMWSERFGPSTRTRMLVSAAGGFLFLFGARLAGGCTSGHIMSGLSQLAVSGAVFAAGVFTTGILTARLLYRRKAS